MLMLVSVGGLSKGAFKAEGYQDQSLERETHLEDVLQNAFVVKISNVGGICNVKVRV